MVVSVLDHDEPQVEALGQVKQVVCLRLGPPVVMEMLLILLLGVRWGPAPSESAHTETHTRAHTHTHTHLLYTRVSSAVSKIRTVALSGVFFQWTV